jgi:hypothetical protein
VSGPGSSWLVGDRFVGRFDGATDRNDRVHAYCAEPGKRGLEDPPVYAGFQRFLGYLGVESVALPNDATWDRASAGSS